MDAPFSYKTGNIAGHALLMYSVFPSTNIHFILHCTVKLDTIFMLFTNSYMTIRGDTEDEI